MSVDSNPKGQRWTRRALEKVRDAVFSNDVFWREWATYLNFGDLKECRLVSQNFNRKVLEATNFKSRGVIVLTRDRLEPTVFGSTVEKWKNVHIKMFQVMPRKGRRPKSGATIDWSWLYPHLSDVEELYVHVSSGFRFHKTAQVYPPLYKLLEATNNCLKKLYLGHDFLHQTDVNIQLPSCETAEKTLANLIELELPPYKGIIMDDPTALFLLGMFGEWMEYLAGALRNLRVLKANGIFLQYSHFQDMGEELHKNVQSLIQLTEVNKSHLKSLQLDDMLLWCTFSESRLQSLSTKIFPCLNSLKIEMIQIESGRMIQFLNQHPLLRDIDIAVVQFFPVELLNYILGRKDLKRLGIKAKTFETSSPILWNLLSDLNSLEGFTLILLYSYDSESANSEPLPSYIANLPPSVKKIHLRGVLTGPERNPVDAAIMPGIFSTLNPELLTELCISNCDYCVDDHLLEFIFRTFRFLRVLNISDTDDKCTDYGFTGRPLKSNSTPFTISNLRGLRNLTLSRCGIISDETLIHEIKFAELSYLDILNNSRITEKGWRAVLAQNPRLEVLKVSDSERHDAKELKKIYPHLKEFEFSDYALVEEYDMLEIPGGWSDFAKLGGINYLENDEDSDDYDSDNDEDDVLDWGHWD